MERRATSEEQEPKDIIVQMLDETTTEVELDNVIRTAINDFDHVVSVYVDHIPTYDTPSSLRICLYTGEAGSVEDPVEVFGPEYRIVIQRDDDRLRLPFRIIASVGGPNDRDSSYGTPVYMHENVVGAQTLDLDVGMEYLRDKLSQPEDWEPETTPDPIARIREQAE